MERVLRMGSKRFDSTGDYLRHRADAALTCAKCKRQVRMTGTALFMLFERGLPIGQAQQRLRCRGCGHRGAYIDPVQR